MKKEFTNITIASTLERYRGEHIGEEVLVFDNLADIPFPTCAKRIQCIFAGLCQEGSAQYSLDTALHTVTPGSVLIISPGQVIDGYRLSPDFRGIGFMMSPRFFSEIAKDVHELSSLFLFARNHPVTQLEPAEAESIRAYFALLRGKIADREHHFRRDVVRMTIATIIYDLGNTIYRVQHTEQVRKSRADVIFADYLRLVELNFRSERRVGWYAAQLHITSKYLSETVKQVSRRTPGDWIDNYLVMEIRVLLKNTRESIKEIASKLNFPTQSFLGKYFKEHTGMSPSEYRRS